MVGVPSGAVLLWTAQPDLLVQYEPMESRMAPWSTPGLTLTVIVLGQYDSFCLCRHGKRTLDCLGWFTEMTDDFGMKLAILVSMESVVCFALARVLPEPLPADAQPASVTTRATVAAAATLITTIRVVCTMRSLEQCKFLKLRKRVPDTAAARP